MSNLKYLCFVLIFMACDPIGECLSVGGLFGPCTPNAGCAEGSGLLCFAAKSGGMCVVPMTSVDAIGQDIIDCAAAHGVLACGVDVTAPDWCGVACVEGECLGGAICDAQTQLCVYPWP